ncbi:glycosyl hydrolase family 28-related protein [Taibaiella helva]|uniref:glycosyl hydrolase family 28-related protein n=1 Tax=Taibaiella helva TaxID=2301235 RepID=UPI000E570E04|nr:glycosyl hydrolase family 28-related protein [Taibaiella helva]
MTVTNIAALTATAPSGNETAIVLGYYEAGDGGGGTFYWDALSAEDPDLGTIFQLNASSAPGRWKRLYAPPLNVKWFGAKGDGIADDTAAIHAAINYSGALAPQSTIFATSSQGAGYTVLLPATKDGYRITAPIRLPGYCALVGEAGGGFRFLEVEQRSALIADFPSAYHWAIETNTYMASNPGLLVPVPYGSFPGTGQIDTFSACCDVQIRDISIIVPGDKRLFGGIRILNGGGAKIKNCFIYGTDIGVLLSASWGSTEVDVQTITIKAGIIAMNSNNNCTVNGYCDRIQNATPLPETTALLQGVFDPSADLPAGYDAKTFGFINNYSNGSASTSLITEHWDVGVAVCNATYACSSFYAEACGEAIVTFAAKATFDLAAGYGNGKTLRAGTRSELFFGTVDQGNTVFAMHDSISQYQCHISVPGTVSAYFPDRNLVHRIAKNTVFVKASGNINDPANLPGNDDNHGFLEIYPVKTLAAALKRVTTGQLGYVYSTSNWPQTEAVSIVILDTENYVLDGEAIYLRNKKLSITGNQATITFGERWMELKDASLVFNNLKIINSAPGSWNNGCIWSTTGTNSVSFEACSVTLDPGKALICLSDPGGSILDMSVYNTDISGDASSLVVQTTYANIKPHFLTYMFGYQSTLSSGLATRGDKGINLPAAWIIKSNA